MGVIFSGESAMRQFWESDLLLVSDRECQNEEGQCERFDFKITDLAVTFPSTDGLWNDLELIFGIGAATALKLKSEGYRSIRDLLDHPRWRRAAAELERVIEARDTQRLVRYGASDLQLLSFYQAEDLLFIDIETTGLFHTSPLFLVGVLKFQECRGDVRLYLARDYSEEKAVLREVLGCLHGVKVLVSYNGRSFDWPYLQARSRYHRMEEELSLFHLDLLRPTRRHYRNALPNCRLLTIERHLLATERNGDVPGSLVPEYYQRFIDTGDIALIQPILYHNAKDVIAMAKLLGVLSAPSVSVSG